MPVKKISFTDTKTFIFVVILCFVCAFTLSLLTEYLRMPQLKAKELYKSKQLLLAAHILSYDGTFLLNGKPAQLKNNQLVPAKKPQKAQDHEILLIFKSRILSRLTDSQGQLYTFDELGIDESIYLIDNEKHGYAYLPYKLVYIVKQNTFSSIPYGYILPVNGYGLWDAIYGYLGLAVNGNTVLGMTWYDQKETPGLGGEIALPEWQKQFFGKEIFKKNISGDTDFESTPIGIQVVKSTVQKTLGETPLAKNAVDGISGASITITGVTQALRNSLSPYRKFLIRAYQGEIQING